MNSYILKNVPDQIWDDVKTMSETEYISIRGIIIKALETYTSGISRAGSGTHEENEEDDPNSPF